MRTSGVSRALSVAILLAAAAPVLAAGVLGDFRVEALPAFTALLHGDFGGFVAQAPAYGASLLPRAPFAWVAHALGAGDLGVYRAVALPCLLAVGLLAVWLEREMWAAGRSLTERAAVVGVCVLAVPVLGTLDAGHPEEALAGVLCVVAVLGALRDRPFPAALALGAAIAVKPWALVAIGPVLFAAPRARVGIAMGTAAVAGAMYLPLLALNAGHVVDATRAATTTGWNFKPQQLWWPLRTERVVPGGLSGFSGPQWLDQISHPLIVLVAVGVSAAAGWRRALVARARGAVSVAPHDALLLLALVLLLRCVLDPWNCLYYVLPCVLALASWEALGPRGLPALSAGVLALSWLTFVGLRGTFGWDGLATAYLVWTVPATMALGARVFLAPRLRSSRAALVRTRVVGKATTGIEPV